MIKVESAWKVGVNSAKSAMQHRKFRIRDKYICNQWLREAYKFQVLQGLSFFLIL